MDSGWPKLDRAVARISNSVKTSHQVRVHLVLELPHLIGDGAPEHHCLAVYSRNVLVGLLG